MKSTRVTVGLVVLAVGAVVLIAAIAGNGSTTHGRAAGSSASLQPAATPTGWKLARTPGGSTFAYPPGWRPIKTDPGTASVALIRGGRIEAYLNATPRQGGETLADWSRFRPHHNLGEGDRGLHVEAVTENVPFRSGRGSCVTDSYTTSKAHYRELACLVSGARSSAVVVAAAPLDQWSRHAPALRRAVSTFTP